GEGSFRLWAGYVPPPLPGRESVGRRGNERQLHGRGRRGSIIVIVVVVVILVILIVFILLILVEQAALGLADLGGQLLRLGRPQQHLFLLDNPVLPQFEEVLVEQEHAVLAAGLDAGVDAVRLVLADEVLDGGRDHHHLVGGDQPLRLFRQKGLRQHSDQRRR